MVEAYRQLAAKTDYPLHLGVTEAGPKFMGTIKSSDTLGQKCAEGNGGLDGAHELRAEGIGDTIRVSLSADPIEEINKRVDPEARRLFHGDGVLGIIDVRDDELATRRQNTPVSGPSDSMPLSAVADFL